MNPYIISVSRREDIPAFRSKWFLEKIEKGFVNMTNFYSDYKVSFDKTKLAVFWSKNPKPLIEHLDKLPFKYYFQFTLNDYCEYELNVPPLIERIETFKELSNKIGKEKVIWRFDPIIVNDELSRADVLRRIKNIGDQLFLYTEKLVFSYIDPYKKLDNKFQEISDDDKIAIAKVLIEFNKVWKLKLSTCAEVINLDGIEHNKCIDPELIQRICGKQRWITNTKDKKQRPACGCMASGDIGSFKMCGHRCTYCYAN